MHPEPKYDDKYFHRLSLKNKFQNQYFDESLSENEYQLIDIDILPSPEPRDRSVQARLGVMERVTF